MKTLSALVSGAIFGLGLTISGMINPAKVLGFLDLFGAWDPSLAFVMGGAFAVTAVGYRLAWRRPGPAFEARFALPTANDVDARLVAGSALFGLGWGLVGLCPGPAIAALGVGGGEAALFFAAMAVGMIAFELFDKRLARI